MRSSSPALLFLPLLLASVVFGQEPSHNDLLYVPEALKPNVAFWELIYQRVPSDRGVLHDQDSLRVIYDTLMVDKVSGRAKSRMVKGGERGIEELLREMAGLDSSQWDESMRKAAAAWGRPLSPDELRDAAARVRFQLGQRDRFIKGLERSGRYLDKIKEVFTEYGLPVELAYLPHVESSFNYKAYSKVGAAGIWQFMRSTGRLYMKMGYVIDERLDPIKSTYAAAKLLKSNHNRLGSWPLAVTAYNHGVNSMERAVRECETTDIGVIVCSYRTRSFQFASKNFYSAFVAAYRSASEYKTHFGEVAIEPPFRYNEYKLDKFVKPAALARMFNVPASVLQEYNLSIRPAVFRSNQFLPKDFVLKLPLEIAQANVDSLIAAAPQDQALEMPPPESFHRVQPGENLSSIAKAYGVGLSALLAANNLTMRSCIYPGQMLMMPGAVAAQAPAAAPAVAAAPASAPVPVAAAAMEPVKAAQPVPDFLTVGKIVAAQAAKPELIDSLPTLWDFLYPAVASLCYVSGTRECDFCEFNANYYALDFVQKLPNSGVIIVQIDETVGHYAEWAGVSSERIRAINHVSSTIHLGQELEIPVTGDKADRFIAGRIEYHMGIEEDFFNNFEITGSDTVKVKSGSSLWNLSIEKDLPLWLILKANPAITTDLRVPRDMNLSLPVAEEKKNGN